MARCSQHKYLLGFYGSLLAAFQRVPQKGEIAPRFRMRRFDQMLALTPGHESYFWAA